MEDFLRILALLALVARQRVLRHRRVLDRHRAARRAARARAARALEAGAAADGRPLAGHLHRAGRASPAIGILTGAIGEPLVLDLLGDAIPHWPRFVIAFAVVTYLSVVVGELVPKALTLDRAETLAALVARPVELHRDRAAARSSGSSRAPRAAPAPFGVSEVMAGASVRRRRSCARSSTRQRARRDPARAGGAAAQRLRLRPARGARRDGARARRGLDGGR